MLASVGSPARVTCSSPGPTRVWKIGATRCVTAVTWITGRSGWASPRYPGNSGMAQPGSGEHVLVHAVVTDLALQDDLGPGDGLGADAHAVDELDGPAAQAAGDGQLVEAEGRGRRLERCRQVDGRVEAHAHGDGQRPPELLGLGAELVDVPGRAREAHGHRVRADEAHAVDGHVGLAGLGVLGAQQRHIEEGPRVAARARRRRQQPAQVERGPQDDLLARRLARRHDDGGHRAARARRAARRPAGRASCPAAAPCAAGWRARRPRPPCRSR